MTTTTPTSNQPDTSTGNRETMIAVFIPAPADINTSICLANPVRRCFSLALGRAVTAMPAIDGVMVSILTTDRERDFPIVREELRALGYDGIAHVGFLVGVGWQCLHGSADFVAGLDQKMRALQSQLEFAHQIQQAHSAAALKPFE